MPNHVKTRMQVAGPAATIDRLIAEYFTEFEVDDWESPLMNASLFGRGTRPKKKVLGLDFEKVIPMPASIHATSTTDEDFRNNVGYRENLAKVGLIALGQEIILHLKKEFAPRVTKDEAKTTYDRDPQCRQSTAIMIAAYNETGCLGWYDWSIQNWGTKWSAYSHEVERSGEGLVVKFDTAWSVPWPILDKLAAEFSELAFEGDSLDELFNFGASFHTKDGLLWQTKTTDGSRMEQLYEVIHGEPYVEPVDDEEDGDDVAA